MMLENNVQQPIKRGRLRRKLGKFYYAFLRKYRNLRSGNTWAKKGERPESVNNIIEHRSMILRPLKDVDMYLQENKRTNLRLAIKHLDGVVIRPGETFSFWQLVGRPSGAKGYLEGLILNQGKIDKGTGGGLCQLGNLLFWMFIHSPLSITERHRHGFDVFPDVNRKIPFGAGATLSYNYIDLQVKNETDNTFFLELWLDEIHLNGRLSSLNELKEKFNIEERNHLIKQQNWGGYTRHNQIFRLIHRDGEFIDEQLVVENHAIMMYNPLLESKA